MVISHKTHLESDNNSFNCSVQFPQVLVLLIIIVETVKWAGKALRAQS